MAPLLEQLLASRPALELALLPGRVPAPAPPVLEPAQWQAALSAHVELSLGGCCLDSTWREKVV